MSLRLYQDADRKLIAELYADHSISILEISARTGASARTIMTIRNEFGVTPRPPGGAHRSLMIPGNIRDRVAELYADPSMTMEKIESCTGVCHNTILRCADERGVPRRREPIDCCEAAELRKKFSKPSDIAYIMGRSRQSVTYALRRHDRHEKAGHSNHRSHQPQEP